MRFPILATDFDGTLANRGRVDPATFAALERWRAAGGRLVLVTGRVMAEQREVCPRLDLFDRIVAENGAVVVRPDGSEWVCGPPPDEGFVAALSGQGAGPVAVGRVVVATWRPDEELAAALIRERGLKLQVILNKRAVMILPEGVGKRSGLAVALGELGASAAEVVGVGDAENDLDFLNGCGLAVAVANALPVVKERAGRVTAGSHGAGVAELIDGLLGEARR